MDIRALIETMLANRSPQALANDPRAQFGTANRRYLGAELLPERPVEENIYEETAIRYRTVIANHGTRYSPVQLKGPNMLVGSFLVKLAEQDIGAEFTSRDYDALRRLLRANRSMEATAAIIRWLDTAIVRALLDLNELSRWQAIVDAMVLARGNMGYSEDIAYSNPAGHRANAAGAYSGGGAVDPFLDIFAMANLLKSKGYQVSRIVTSTPILNKILSNPHVAERLGTVRIVGPGDIGGIVRRATLEAVNGLLRQDNLPPFEVYDEMYNTETGTNYFLKRDVIVMVATTGQDEEIRLGEDRVEVLQNTLGYHAIGVPAGQDDPGRVITMTPHMNSKPPRIEAEGWQTSLPVIMQPEAIAVIKNIT